MDESRISKITTFCDEEIERRKKDGETRRKIKKYPSGKSDVETYLSMAKDYLKRSDYYNELAYGKPLSKELLSDPSFITKIELENETFTTFLSDINKELKAQTLKYLDTITPETINEVVNFQIAYEEKSVDISFLTLLTTEIRFRTTVELSNKTFDLSNLTKTISIITLIISAITLGTVAYYSSKSHQISRQNYKSSKIWQETQTPILKVIEKILMTPENNSLQQSQIEILKEIRDRIPTVEEQTPFEAENY